MSDEDRRVQIEDPPDPALPELQQRELPLPVVPVDVMGKARVQILPARHSAVFTQALDTTLRRVLGADPKRARTTLLSLVEWRYSRTRSGDRVPWPANVPLVICHYDEVYAAAATGTGTLSVIAEMYAD